ncbi:MAG: hypothetical protein Kow0089_17090 [Desulfobulbaceae bacterium]
MAGSESMLSFCEHLLEQYDREESALLPMEINTLCAEMGVLPGLLYEEVRKALIALNRYHDGGRDHYATLGLQEGASSDEVKKAYRSLSKKFHPDGDGNDSNTKLFMEISGAYHAIMASGENSGRRHHRVWRKKRKDGMEKKRRERKNVATLFLCLLTLLAGLSLYLSTRYDETIHLDRAQLRTEKVSQPPVVMKKPVAGQADVTPETKKVKTVQSAVLENRSSLPFLSPEKNEQPPPSPAPEREQSPGREEQQMVLVNVARSETTHQLASDAAEQDEVKSSLSPSAVKIEVPKEPAIEKEPFTAVYGKKMSEKKPAAAPPEGTTTIRSADPDPDSEKLSAVPAIETGDRELPPETQTSRDVFEILDRYVALYTMKELDAFLALFTADARENGHPQSELKDQYRSLFAHTETIELALSEARWERRKNEILAHTTFNSAYTYKDGRRREHRGTISFVLVRDGGGLKIRELDYAFLE